MEKKKKNREHVANKNIQIVLFICFKNKNEFESHFFNKRNDIKDLFNLTS